MTNSRFVAPFSDSQLRAAAIVPKVAAFPSILGSLFIVQHVLRSKERRGRVYHRLLLLMSANDLVFSMKSFVSTWPQPKGTPFSYGAAGNTATCTVAGFLGHGSALTSICYNLSLTIFFLMVVRYGWRETQIKKRVEFWLHFVPFLVGWSTATAGLFLKLFNAFGWTCWINSYPVGCTDNVNCERGDNAGIYRWAFFHSELWTCYALTLLSMILIYNKIADQERVMAKYVFRSAQPPTDQSIFASPPESERVSRAMIKSEHQQGEEEQKRPGAPEIEFRNPENEPPKKRSTLFALQATFYVGVFFLTWFVPMLQAVFSVQSDTLYFPLILLASILSSMQGFSNAAIYLRPRWIEFRKQHPRSTRLQVLHYALGLRDPRGEQAVRSRNSPKMSVLSTKRPYVSSIKNDDIVFEPTQASSDPLAAIISDLSCTDALDEEQQPEANLHQNQRTSSNEIHRAGVVSQHNHVESLNAIDDSGYMF